MEKDFYDLVYDAWMSGKNPDMVSEDRYDDMRSQEYYPDEISIRDVYPRYTPKTICIIDPPKLSWPCHHGQECICGREEI